MEMTIKRSIVIGIALMLVGWFILLGMTIHRIPSTFFLNISSYFLTILGLTLGIRGAWFIYIREREKGNRQKGEGPLNLKNEYNEEE